MAKKKAKTKSPRTWRPSPEDDKLMGDLRGKLGVSEPDVLRIAVRKLAEQEGLR